MDKNIIITASLVLYNTKDIELELLCNSINNSDIDKLYIIDHSPISIKEKIPVLNKKNEYFFIRNKGYGTGHNYALKKISKLNESTYHIILNPDIVFENNCIKSLLSYMNANQDVGLVMPKVLYPSGELQYLCKLLPSPFNILQRKILPKNKLGKREKIYRLEETGYNKIMNVPCLSGCFMFIRLSVLQDIGFFDERFFMYFEDLDF